MAFGWKNSCVKTAFTLCILLNIVILIAHFLFIFDLLGEFPLLFTVKQYFTNNTGSVDNPGRLSVNNNSSDIVSGGRHRPSMLWGESNHDCTYTTEIPDYSKFTRNTSKVRCDAYESSTYTTRLQFNKTLDKDLLKHCQRVQKMAWSCPGIYWNNKTAEMSVKTRCGYVVAESVTRYNISGFRQDDDALPVPNIVHYVNFGPREFSFLNYLSVLSVFKFGLPDAIFIHGDRPNGVWWTRTIKDVRNLYFVPYAQPRYIQGRNIASFQHASDLLRLSILRGKISLNTTKNITLLFVYKYFMLQNYLAL